MKFEKGKVYTTLDGQPAKVLFICKYTGQMWVLHSAYTRYQRVLVHNTFTGEFNSVFPEHNLTEELYA